jgi:hypothetical protein
MFRTLVPIVTVAELHSLLTIGFSDRLAGGFGHMGHFHRAGGVMIGAKIIIFGMVAVFACALGAMASLSGSDWVTTRTRHANYGRAAGWVIFLVVAAVAAIGLARLL